MAFALTGEIIMRWGIFWRKLQFDIYETGDIIKAAMLLHNFIINEREEKGFHEEEAAYFREFSLRQLDSRRQDSSEVPSAVATDNNEPRPGGRRQSMEARDLQDAGEFLRQSIASRLYGKGLGRPVTDDMAFNSEGQVYFTAT